jgi:hypothetical protein
MLHLTSLDCLANVSLGVAHVARVAIRYGYQYGFVSENVLEKTFSLSLSVVPKNIVGHSVISSDGHKLSNDADMRNINLSGSLEPFYFQEPHSGW